jgi:hypothetical protein
VVWWFVFTSTIFGPIVLPGFYGNTQSPNNQQAYWNTIKSSEFAFFQSNHVLWMCKDG